MSSEPGTLAATLSSLPRSSSPVSVPTDDALVGCDASGTDARIHAATGTTTRARNGMAHLLRPPEYGDPRPQSIRRRPEGRPAPVFAGCRPRPPSVDSILVP